MTAAITPLIAMVGSIGGAFEDYPDTWVLAALLETLPVPTAWIGQGPLGCGPGLWHEMPFADAGRRLNDYRSRGFAPTTKGLDAVPTSARRHLAGKLLTLGQADLARQLDPSSRQAIWLG